MDRYQKVERPKPELPINENEIRITSQGLVRNYINYALSLLQERRGREIVLKAMGQAISKTVAIAEIIKRRVPRLHQDTAISSVSITDVWEPIEEGLLPVEMTRQVSMISITLSPKELDKNTPGYQPPAYVEQSQQARPQYNYQQRQPRQLQYNYQQQQQQQPRQAQYNNYQQQQQPRQAQYNNHQQPRESRAIYNAGDEDTYGGGRGRGRGQGRGRGRGVGRGWSRGGYGNYQENGGYSNWNQGGGRGGNWGYRGAGYGGGRGGRGGGGGRGGYGYGRGGRGRMGGGSRPVDVDNQA